MNKDVLRLLENVDWKTITLKLARYTKLKIDRLFWRNGVIPQGNETHDIVADSIVAIFEGDRKWNPSINPDLYNYLKSVVDSKVSHLYESIEYKTTDRFRKDEKGKDIEEFLRIADPSLDHASHLVQCQFNQEEAILEKENNFDKKQNDEKTLDNFFEAIDGHEELEELASIIMGGISKPSEIAKKMGKNVKYVYNLQKKFRRKCKEFRNNLKR